MITKKRNCDIRNTLIKRGCGFIVSGSVFFFVEFDTLDLEIFVICWIEPVNTVDDLCLTNQIYSVLLNTFEVKEITEVQNAHLKMLLEDDET